MIEKEIEREKEEETKKKRASIQCVYTSIYKCIRLFTLPVPLFIHNFKLYVVRIEQE